VWAKALKGAGLTGVHVHDLRHTGNHFAAMTGASTRELMGRMGHVSMDAALVYQHRTADRDRAIAAPIDLMLAAGDAAQARVEGDASEDLGHAEGTKSA
jgi:integrase